MSDIEATADKYLRDKYAIIGVGETTYTRGSGMTTRALGTWAIKNAMDDAGIRAGEIDGMMSYSGNDSTASPMLAGDLGIRLCIVTALVLCYPRLRRCRWSAPATLSVGNVAGSATPNLPCARVNGPKRD